MNNIEALDIVFNFLPKNILEKIKKQGLYEPILSKKISTGAELYDYLSEEHATLQDNNYDWLADELKFYMNPGSILQIACGRGDLLMRLANLGFSPIYGIDRSKVMLQTCRERLKKHQNTFIIQQNIEQFDFQALEKIDNVIINNFWGMISETESINLLNNLKKCLSANALVFIGNYSEKTREKQEAEKVLKNNLNFIFSYPFFKKFSSCGYTSKIITINSFKYFMLNCQTNEH